MEKNFPPITEDQVDKIIENFGSYSKSTDDLDLPEADSSSSKNSENDSPAEILNIAATATDNNVVPTENNCNADFSKEEKTNDTQKNFPKSTVKLSILTIMVLVLAWLLPSGNVMNINPASASSKDRDTFFRMSSQNLLSDSLSEVHVIPRKYVLELSDTLTPSPDESKFTEKYDIERKNYDGTPISYYKDDSIEVKCWREKIGENVFNFSEVWISDPSQLRRTLVDNVISKKHLDYPQNIFIKTNGVVGMSADYCAFRNFGIIMQYGNVVRGTDGSILDIAVYDTNGNFSVYEDNNDFFETAVFKNGEVLHTFAFGPVLVDNYVVSDSYKITLPGIKYPGELNQSYPRAAICQFDYDKHYLLCTVDFQGISAKDFAGVLQSKGVRFAYNLDGGQTATLMFNKKIFNNVAYGGPRLLSDILYFATAVPNY